MWWRFLTFCVLVTFVLFVVLSCIHGRPVIYLFFHRCCEDDIENDPVIFENFENNYLRERLVGVHIVEEDKEGFVSDSEVEDVIKALKAKMNVHDPKGRVELDIAKENDINNETSTDSILKAKELDNEITMANDKAKENTTLNDLLSDSQEIEGKMKNDVLSELDSDEDSSPEVTTESSVNKMKLLPIKLIESRKILNQSETVSSVRNVTNSSSVIR